MAVMTYIDAINSALREEMERDSRVFIIGEDVGRMGGAFKATKGLLDEFGSERVIDSPLAEGVIVSSSIGAALAGMRPVPEIQFVDFITPAMDAITQQGQTSLSERGHTDMSLDCSCVLRRQRRRRALSLAEQHHVVCAYSRPGRGSAFHTIRCQRSTEGRHSR